MTWLKIENVKAGDQGQLKMKCPKWWLELEIKIKRRPVKFS
jgi:hypothetical protein